MRVLVILLLIYTKHCFKHFCAASCAEDVLANSTYGMRGFVVLIQIDYEIGLDEYLIVQVLAYMVSVVMAYKPTNSFNLPFRITSKTC